MASRWRGGVAAGVVALAAVGPGLAPSRPGAASATAATNTAATNTAATNTATVTVNGAEPHQTMVGFGGEIGSLLVGQLGDLAKTERTKLFDFTFRRGPSGMGVNFPRWTNGGYPEEGGLRPGAVGIWGANDNADPNVIDWSTFKWGGVRGPLPEDQVGRTEAEIQGEVASLGVTGGYFGSIQGPKWNGFWTDNDGPAPPDTLATFSVDEMVENKLALLLHYRKYGVIFPLISPFSEPSGGGINWVITPDDVVQVIKRLGQKLEANGFKNVKMSVPGCTNLADSLRYTQAILADPEARKYVGAIEYHSYGQAGDLGGPDPPSQNPEYVTARQQLRDLAATYNLPVRMTEYADEASMLDRANSIFNEFEYADSQTYFPLFVFTTKGQSDFSAIVSYTVSPGGQVSNIAPTLTTGVAIGQYSRYVFPGSVRLETTSSDPGVRGQAFRDDATHRLSLVIINNNAQPEAVSADLSGPLHITGPITGGQTVQGATAYWTPVSVDPGSSDQGAAITVPAQSITTLDIPLPGRPAASTPGLASRPHHRGTRWSLIAGLAALIVLAIIATLAVSRRRRTAARS